MLEIGQWRIPSQTVDDSGDLCTLLRLVFLGFCFCTRPPCESIIPCGSRIPKWPQEGRVSARMFIQLFNKQIVIQSTNIPLLVCQPV